jgi:mono/diheme cytochrome c family protein
MVLPAPLQSNLPNREQGSDQPLWSLTKAIRIIQISLLFSCLLLAACGGGSSSTFADPALAQGERVYKRECSICHSLKPDETIVGPSLAGIATRAATRVEGLDSREYIQLSIIKPSEFVVDGFVDQMPSGFGKSLSEDEFDGIVRYLLTLE